MMWFSHLRISQFWYHIIRVTSTKIVHDRRIKFIDKTDNPIDGRFNWCVFFLFRCVPFESNRVKDITVLVYDSLAINADNPVDLVLMKKETSISFVWCDSLARKIIGRISMPFTCGMKTVLWRLCPCHHIADKSVWLVRIALNFIFIAFALICCLSMFFLSLSVLCSYQFMNGWNFLWFHAEKIERSKTGKGMPKLRPTFLMIY